MAEHEFCFSLWEKGQQRTKVEGNLADFLSDPLKWVAKELQKELQKHDTDLTKARLLNEIIIFINANSNLLIPTKYTGIILARETQDK